MKMSPLWPFSTSSSASSFLDNIPSSSQQQQQQWFKKCPGNINQACDWAPYKDNPSYPNKTLFHLFYQ
jgi:hypothetical protein